MDDDADLYKAREVAALLRVDTKTVYAWVKAGAVAHIRTPHGGGPGTRQRSGPDAGWEETRRSAAR